MPAKTYVGTAGWSIPGEQQRRFPGSGSHLERYARVFPAVEINSTFYKSHRAATFERWAASVPRTFRFSVKVPQAITHDRRLARCASLLDAFLDEVAPLRARLGCLLVQLPPGAAFDARVVRAFLAALRKRFDRGIALEPRHASWFDGAADRLLADFEVARVAADPARADGAGEPGGWPGLVYIRLHGSPRIYYSPYEPGRLEAIEATLRDLTRRRIPAWCIFDNTAHGAATGNALSVVRRLRPPRSRA